MIDGIVHSDTPGMIEIRGLDWVNNGSLQVTGDQSELWLRDRWINHGPIEAVDAGRLILGDGDEPHQNLGTITATNAEVRLDGAFAIDDLGTFDFTDSLVVIDGTLVNNTGLVLDAAQFNWKLGTGTILGGSISSADGTAFEVVRACCGAMLDGVILDANMRMPRGTSVSIKNGITLNGVLRMDGFGSNAARLDVVEPNRSIDGTGQIEFVSTGGNDILQGSLGGSGDLGVMAIGPGITIFGAKGNIGTGGGSNPASVLNEGMIHSDRPGIITIKGTDSINNGVIKSSSSGGSIIVSDSWTNNGTVHVAGGSIFADDPWTNNGTVLLEAGPALDSSSDFTQTSAGAFVSRIRSTAVDGYGKMIVAGTATLAGTLRVEFESVYTPQTGDSFVVLQYGGHVGEFESIEVAGLDAGFNVVPNYQGTFFGLVIEPQ